MQAPTNGTDERLDVIIELLTKLLASRNFTFSPELDSPPDVTMHSVFPGFQPVALQSNRKRK